VDRVTIEPADDLSLTDKSRHPLLLVGEISLVLYHRRYKCWHKWSDRTCSV